MENKLIFCPADKSEQQFVKDEAQSDEVRSFYKCAKCQHGIIEYK